MNPFTQAVPRSARDRWARRHAARHIRRAVRPRVVLAARVERAGPERDPEHAVRALTPLGSSGHRRTSVPRAGSHTAPDAGGPRLVGHATVLLTRLLGARPFPARAVALSYART
jgi:hypothetical protein